MTGDNRILNVEDLQVDFYPGDPHRGFSAVCSADFSVNSGTVVGLVGESGCGKSVSALTVPDLLPDYGRATGRMIFDGQNYNLPDGRQKNLRGRQVGMIFQEPASALNPVFSVRSQLVETLEHRGNFKNADEVEARAVELLKKARLENPADKLEKYPHQLSGGQCQRVTIALALASEPRLLIADEPTTALDASLRREVIELLVNLAGAERGILLISHDLNLISTVVDRIVIMYSGYTVESGPANKVVTDPAHPYTRGLLRSSTALFSDSDRLPVIPGEVPEPIDRPSGCPFHPRCSEARDQCTQQFPGKEEIGAGWWVSCWARGGIENAT